VQVTNSANQSVGKKDDPNLEFRASFGFRPSSFEFTSPIPAHAAQSGSPPRSIVRNSSQNRRCRNPVGQFENQDSVKKCL
jgi:hypothetical protein